MSAPITTVTVVQAAMGQVYRSVEVRPSDAVMGWRQLPGHRGRWDFTRTGQRRTPRHRDGELPRHPSGEGMSRDSQTTCFIEGERVEKRRASSRVVESVLAAVTRTSPWTGARAQGMGTGAVDPQVVDCLPRGHSRLVAHTGVGVAHAPRKPWRA